MNFFAGMVYVLIAIAPNGAELKLDVGPWYGQKGHVKCLALMITILKQDRPIRFSCRGKRIGA